MAYLCFDAYKENELECKRAVDSCSKRQPLSALWPQHSYHQELLSELSAACSWDGMATTVREETTVSVFVQLKLNFTALLVLFLVRVG